MLNGVAHLASTPVIRDMQDWNTLSTQEKKLYARMMEVFAGFLTHIDFHYGRLSW